MKVYVVQIYIEPGVDFPFSYHLQRRLAREIRALVRPSPMFIRKYGRDFKLGLNISAKRRIKDNEVRGPTVFRKAKDVEYSIFLPFDVIMRDKKAPKTALKFLLRGIRSVLQSLDIDSGKLAESQESLIEEISSDPKMLEAPSFEESQNRPIFEKYFAKKAIRKNARDQAG